MPKLCDKKDCTGCAACLGACTHGAITFNKDRYGFAYPQIDGNKCVDCKFCEKRCPILNEPEYKYPQAAYACYAKNDEERQASSSGGFGTQVAKYIVERGGVVYGCAFIPPFSVKHIRCTTAEDIEKLRGSKYVQSDLTGIYPQLKQDLKDGKEVLFIGTPCQSGAIRSSFKRFQNLYVIDLVCHGVPSMQFLGDTLPKGIIDAEKTDMSFRNNTKYHFSIKNGISTIFERPLNKDIYMKGFFTGVLFRSGCFGCRFSKPERTSDITMADFWGLKSTRITDMEKGISLALINTEKGNELFNSIKENLVYELRPVEEGIAGNGQLNHSSHKSFRERIFKSLYPYIGYKMSLWLSMPDRLLGTKIKSILTQK